MSYIKRDWDNTSNDVTKEDFKRIENGVEANDIKINVLCGVYVDNINKINKSGKYIIGTGTVGSPSPGSTFGCDATFESATDGSIIAICYFNKAFATYLGVVSSGVFQGWQQISTIEEIPITLQNGWVLESGYAMAIRVGRVIHFPFSLRLGAGEGATMFSLPYSLIGKNYIVGIQDNNWGFSQSNISASGNDVIYWGASTDNRVDIPNVYII